MAEWLNRVRQIAQERKAARMTAGQGGMTAPIPPAMPIDPSGLVPVNRTQPMQGDGGEAQRMMERRMATMPPPGFADPNMVARGGTDSRPGHMDGGAHRTVGLGLAQPAMPPGQDGRGPVTPEMIAAMKMGRQYGAPQPMPVATTNQLDAPVAAFNGDRMEFLRQQLARGETRNNGMTRPGLMNNRRGL